jgi:hypothetical protein
MSSISGRREMSVVGLLVPRSRRRPGSRLLGTRFSGFTRSEPARSCRGMFRMPTAPSGAALHGLPARFLGRRVHPLSGLSACRVGSFPAIANCHRSSSRMSGTPIFGRTLVRPIVSVFAQYPLTSPRATIDLARMRRGEPFRVATQMSRRLQPELAWRRNSE